MAGSFLSRTTTSKHRGLRRLWIGGAVCALVFPILASSAWCVIQWHGNFHEVQPGQVYRSAQLDRADLQQVIMQYGIKSVLNLRGANVGEAWYDNELAVTKADGVKHLDASLSAYAELSGQQMDALIRQMKDAPKPLLVHCESGADRTGLASALYRLSQGVPAETAREELEARFGHMPLFTPRSAAMDRSFAAYASGNHDTNATRGVDGH